ncbi:MAG TPA: sigma-70 family RNA polymerase sigma factor, partial [Isosphaeraceae bacterium]|nr:sigma-70 family RNA polymerase sigma factor [Isosphaeraceae bacterium]
GTLGGLGDGQLLERYLAGRDEAAFEALVDLHGPMVLGLCRRMLRDPRDIEDAFQATFLVLVRKAPAIRDRGLLSSWLYGVAYRVARRARAQTLRRRVRETAVAELEVATAPENSDGLEISPVLDQELTRLPQKYRAPLVLCYLQGRTHEQAAAELHCPVGTVRSRLARGRDLLKKRLTRRGYAPTATILGTGSTVPPSLVSTTVQAALGFGSSSTIPSGVAAASALALAQGVLTTMKLAQWKWIGLAILATGLSAGGVVVVTYAEYQTPPGTVRDESGDQGERRRREARARLEEAQSALREAHGRREAATDELARARQMLSDAQGKLALAEEDVKQIRGLIATLQDQLQGGEARRDATGELPKRRGATPPASVPKSSITPPATTAPIRSEPNRPIPAPARPDSDSRRTSSTPTNSIRELEVQLQLALEMFELREKLYQAHTISTELREQARGKVLLTAAQLEDLDADLADEIERLKLEMRRKNAERAKAQAQEEVAAVVAARNKRLNDQTPGSVAPIEVAKAEGELKIAMAQIGITEAEINEVGLRIQQLQRRHERIKQVITLADRAKAAAPARPTP